MPNRRMIARDVVGRDEFITLSHSAQALFLHLTAEADDAGLVGTVERVLRTVNCTAADIESLIEHGIIIRFESGVIALRHWNVANSLKNDRYPTNHRNEYEQLDIDKNKAYYLIPEVSKMVPEVSNSIPNVTQVNQTEPNQKEKKGTQLIGREESAREGEQDGRELFTDDEYKRIQEMYDPEYLDSAIKLYKKQATNCSNHLKAFIEYADKYKRSLRKKGAS